LDGLVAPSPSFLVLHQETKKGTNNQSRERVVISTKYFRTSIADGSAFFAIRQFLIPGKRSKRVL
jgi:hypothetical protein